MKCWICGQVGHIAVNCPTRRCWFCGGPGHLKRNSVYRNGREKLGGVLSGLPRQRGDRGLLLLPVPMAGVTHNWEPRRRKAKVFSSLTQEKELPCNAKIGGIAMKVLIDR